MADYRDPEQLRPAGNSPTNIWPNNQPATNIYGVARAGRTTEVTNETIQGPNRGSVGRSGENVPGVQLEAAGPAGSGGAVGGGGRSGGGSSVTGIQGGASGQPLDQLFPRTRSTLRDAGSEISGAIRDGKYATALGSTVGKALKLPETLADDVIGGFGRGAFSLLRNPAEDFGRAAVGLPERPQTPQPSTPAASPTSIKNPYANVTPEQGRAMAAVNAAANAGTASQPQAEASTEYTNNVTRDGNSYSGTNVRGDITINGFPPGAGLGRTGPSDQNMAAADALAARDGLRSAAAVGVPQLVTPMLTTGNSDNSWSARNNLRNLETSASSIYHTQSHWGNRGKAAADTQAYLDAVKTDTALRAGADPMALTSMKLRADEANNIRTTDASRYGADQTLRGNVYQADATLGAKRMESQLKYGQQAAMGQIFRMAGNNPAKAAEIAAMYGLDAKPFIDMAQSTQTRQYNASTNAQSRLESLAIDPATNEISKGRLAQVRAAANSAVPGFEQMDEAEQNKHWKTVTAAVKAVQGLNATRDNGLLDFLSPESPALTQLPNVEGRRIERVSPWEGLTTRKVGHGDYKLTKPDAPPLYIPQQNVDENTLGMLKLRGATILDK